MPNKLRMCAYSTGYYSFITFIVGSDYSVECDPLPSSTSTAWLLDDTVIESGDGEVTGAILNFNPLSDANYSNVYTCRRYFDGAVVFDTSYIAVVIGKYSTVTKGAARSLFMPLYFAYPILTAYPDPYAVSCDNCQN